MIYEASITHKDRQLLSCRGSDKTALLGWIYRQLELYTERGTAGFLYDHVNQTKRIYTGDNPHRD